MTLMPFKHNAARRHRVGKDEIQGDELAGICGSLTLADTGGACHVACSTPNDAWWPASLFGMIGTASAKPIKGSTDPNNPST